MQKKGERVTILIDESTKKRLVKAATDEDKTVSQVIRGLIRSHIQLIDIQPVNLIPQLDQHMLNELSQSPKKGVTP